MHDFRWSRALVALALITAACSSRDAAGRGTLVITMAADAKVLIPNLIGETQNRAVNEVLFDKLADPGVQPHTASDAGYRPRLARAWEWTADSTAVTFRLDSTARWHDGTPVTAGDVRFAYQVYTDPKTASSAGGDLVKDVDSVTVADPRTVTVWFKQRSLERFYNVVVTLIPLPEHLLGAVPHDSLRLHPFGKAPVGSGPFRFVKWVPAQRIELAAVDSFYRGRAKLDRVVWSIAADMAGSVQKLFAGEADFLEAVPASDVPEAAKHADVRIQPLPGFNYNFVGWNLRDGAAPRPHPLFSDLGLRRALGTALDRRAMVRTVLDSLGDVALGPFARAQWSADTTIPQPVFDTAATARALDSLGWKRGADGMRARNGRPLAFSLLVPSSSRNRVRYSVLLEAQWRAIGAAVAIETVDGKTFNERLGAGTFDAYLGGVTVTPSAAGVRQLWSTASFAQHNGFNPGGWSNPAFDAGVDRALGASDEPTARTALSAAYRALVADAPATFLYEARGAAGINTRVVTGPIRPDAWWATLEQWSIAPGRSLPRDIAAPTP